MAAHRMQHRDPPSWCMDCGRFEFACLVAECPSPGSGDFDQATERGFQRIAEEAFGTFGIKKPGAPADDHAAKCRS